MKNRNWIIIGVISGLLSTSLFLIATQVSISYKINAVMFNLVGWLLAISMIGVYLFLKNYRDSLELKIGTFLLMLGGFANTLMATMQGANRIMIRRYMMEADATDQLLYKKILNGVFTSQVGIDYAFDLFFSTGVAIWSISLLKHPLFGKWFGWSGIVLAFVGIVMNTIAFPMNPHSVGLVDPGPLFALWSGFMLFKIIWHLIKSKEHEALA